MNEIILPIVAYSAYATLELIPIVYSVDVEKTDVLFQSPIDWKLWNNGVLSLCINTFLLISRFAKWAYLIIYGVKVLWWPPLIAFAIAFPVSVILSSLVPRRVASIFILPLLPILLIILFFTISWV